MTGKTSQSNTAALETDLELVGIVAVAENGVIGRDGEMPWHIPEDLAHFKRHTIGHPVIMGRVTYEAILEALGEPLPGRTTIVLTRQGADLETPAHVVVAGDLESALAAAETAARGRHDGTDRAFVAGGATIYEQFFSALDRLVLTEVHDTPEGDAFFPDWDRESWTRTACENRDGFSFFEFVRDN